MPWLLLFRVGVIFSSVALLGGLYWHYTHTIAENQRLRVELHDANATITALDTLVKAHNQIRETERGLIDEIEAAPAEHDAPTAPVLRSAIERLH